MQTATIPRTAPLALWRIAEAFLHVLYSLFGAPEDVAREHTLTRAAHTLLLSWLRVGEALLRRLLVVEAALSPTAPRSSPAKSSTAPKSIPHLHTARIMRHPSHTEVHVLAEHLNVRDVIERESAVRISPATGSRAT